METQKLILAEDVFDALEYNKRCTIRKGIRDIKLGSLVFESLEEKREVIVEVTRVIYCKLKDVPNSNVINDGFENHLYMLDVMQRFYPDIDANTECTVVDFEI